ncbi:uncharacterized protein F5Z01DRAFT_635377 [Emericellopsis atlantica]|uniref:Cyanovirin-N domain-containing protein n=1 Tax=Emericellopsis atlantica TaxID=2614577 RepID=A0A9P7ZP90_9HYPO|nr:uncharacterized protein F5Z01DRAFT_635377 [Emericellopsis atlantica]KAG9255758.1 hypothetical protein F5Z01DRAFT_635377 [Emericellopsis atlantica]
MAPSITSILYGLAFFSSLASAAEFEGSIQGSYKICEKGGTNCWKLSDDNSRIVQSPDGDCFDFLKVGRLGQNRSDKIRACNGAGRLDQSGVLGDYCTITVGNSKGLDAGLFKKDDGYHVKTYGAVACGGELCYTGGTLNRARGCAYEVTECTCSS